MAMVGNLSPSRDVLFGALVAVDDEFRGKILKEGILYLVALGFAVLASFGLVKLEVTLLRLTIEKQVSRTAEEYREPSELPTSYE